MKITRQGAACLLSFFLLFFASAIRELSAARFGAGLEDPFLRSLTSLVVFSIYAALIISWAISVRLRIVDAFSRRALVLIAGLLIFLITIRTIRHSNTFWTSDFQRFLWYLYHIPTICLPLIAFYMSFHLGRSDSYRIDPRWYLLALPAAFLMASVVTNDLHHWFFRPLPEASSRGLQYEHQWLYYLMAAWVILLLLASLANMIRNETSAKRIRLPLIVLFSAVGVSILYPLGPAFRFFEWVAILSFSTVMFWEACIATGLIASNTRYREMFLHSRVGAQIIDREGRARYRSLTSLPVEDVRPALASGGEPVSVRDEYLLHVMPLSGGFVVWQEEIGELHRVARQLAANAQELEHGVGELEDELSVRKRRLALDERNRLYDLVSERCSANVERLRELAAELDSAEDPGENLRRLYLLGTYVKRRTNLILLADGKEPVDPDELRIAFRDTMAGLAEIPKAYRVDLDAPISAEDLLFCYELLNEVLKSVIYSCEAVYVTVSRPEKEKGILCAVSVEWNDLRPALPPELSEGRNVSAEYDEGEKLAVFRYQAEGGAA